MMDAIRAELEDWSEKQEVAPSREVMDHFYAESFDGATVGDLAKASVETILSMIGPAPVEVLSEYMATFCSGILLGVRAARRLEP
jgi:hypothetical protein